MKHHYIRFDNPFWKVVVILFFLSLYACGGEENADTSAASEHSSRLTDNNVPAGMSFTNFKHETFSMDPSLLALSGNRLFLKLNRQEGEVLFLGEIDRYRPFSISVEVRLHDTQLHYELFTDDVNDNTQFGVISL